MKPVLNEFGNALDVDPKIFKRAAREIKTFSERSCGCCYAINKATKSKSSYSIDQHTDFFEQLFMPEGARAYWWEPTPNLPPFCPEHQDERRFILLLAAELAEDHNGRKWRLTKAGKARQRRRK
jgi:hypothetical protein